MKKIFLNIGYKLENQLSWVLWYLGLYTIILFLAYFFLIRTSILTGDTGNLSYRLWGAVLFSLTWLPLVELHQELDGSALAQRLPPSR